MRTEHLIELKKLNIIKHLLIQEDESTLSIFKELFEIEITEKNNFIKNIEKQIESNSFLNALNDINIIIREVSSSIFKNPCPEMALELIPTGEDKIRFCKVCKKNVYIVENEKELEQRKKLGQCVRINLSKFIPNKEHKKNFKACYDNIEEINNDYDGLPM
ncbi:hypothetical protein SAMN05216480_10338 [Pustulibacterium marinum]|uniref:Uncharacterized protein n=1 Tax=Pustulibacterium marinum TaxID=1224947 RepID=A0A1I7G0W4_9FLAO|nr:hypothetical protein [Pustulibacterium marinum]SFU42057.1 hypothetical protein SAMN05216480_10338 [Pustulibacterium marinum]